MMRSLTLPIVVSGAVATALAGCPGTGSNLVPQRAVSSKTASLPTTSQVLTLFAGGTMGSVDGLGAAAKFDGPNGLDIDVLGRLIVAEAGGNRIRRIEPNGQTSVVAGGKRGWRDGKKSEAQFNGPYGVAARRDGIVLVADTGNHRIRAIASDGTVTTLAGDGTPGADDGEGTHARFRSPFAIAVTALDEVIVADTGNHRLRLIDRDGKVSTLAGDTAGYEDGSLGAARFNGPADVAIDRFGHIYVADLRNNVVRLVKAQDGTVETLAGAAQEGDVDGERSNARFRLPSGLAVDLSGNVYVADAGNAAVKRIAANGRVSTVARAERTAPTDIVATADGRLYVTDTGGQRILRSD